MSNRRLPPVFSPSMRLAGPRPSAGGLAFAMLAACTLCCCGDGEEEELPEGGALEGVSALDATSPDDAPDTPAPPLPDPGLPPPDPGKPADQGPVAEDPGPDTNVVPDPRAKPRVVALSVTSGPTAGGTSTVILCVGFPADFRDVAPAVTFGDAPASVVEALSKGVVEVSTPASSAGPVGVTVTAGGQSAALADAFEYVAALPADYVEVAIAGAIEPGGVLLQLPLTVAAFGTAKPAALLVNVNTDPLLLPLASPNCIEGPVPAASEKVLTTKSKNDGLRLLLLHKNRKTIQDGTIAQLYYNVPPAEPGKLTPLTVTATAVDAFGAPIQVVTKSGWMVVAESE